MVAERSASAHSRALGRCGLWALALLGGCASAPAVQVVPQLGAEADVAPALEVEPTTHLDGAWLAVRAQRFTLDVATAAQRDRAFAIAPPEDGLWWDEQLAQEVWGVWHDECLQCHAGTRSLAKVRAMPPPPRRWAEQEARYFARRSTPRHVYRVIAEGQKAHHGGKDMPAWGARLSHEQIWGLTYFLRMASRPRT